MKILISTVIALGLAGSALSVPASAADVVGVHIGGAGLGVTVGNGHYYDRHHHRMSYRYPSDWKSYHHDQSWYHSHSDWQDQNGHNYYRN